MATGFRLSNGLDLDQVFAARVSAAGASVGFRNSAGSDLSTVLEPGQLGVYASLTGYKNSAGVDFKSLFSTVAGAPSNFSVSPVRSVPSGTAGITTTVNADGSVTSKNETGTAMVGSGNWFSPNLAGVGSSYQVKFTLTSGTAWTGAAVNTWLAFPQSVGLTTSGVEKTNVIAVSIRRTSDSVVVCSGTISLDVVVGGV